MMMNKKTIFFFVLALASLQGYAQKARKLSFIGGARSSVFSNALSVSDTLADTTTAKNNYGGYTLLDLGFNIQPNKQTEIMGMFQKEVALHMKVQLTQELMGLSVMSA